MKHDNAEERLRTILKENGLEKPGELFSGRLVHAVVQQQRNKAAASFKAGKWIGKLILGILVFFNLLFLYYLNPFPHQSILFISIAAFVAGIWGIIAVAGRFQLSKPDRL